MRGTVDNEGIADGDDASAVADATGEDAAGNAGPAGSRRVVYVR